MGNIWLAKVEEIAAAIEARADECDATDTFVGESYKLLAEQGLFKALVPAEFGGGGATVSEVCAAIRRLGQACGSTALAFSMHSHLVAVAAWRWRHEGAPTEGLLRKVGEDGVILVSSGGSDWLPSGGTAVKVDGGYQVSAVKPFSSGSPAAQILGTSAQYDDPEAGPMVIHFPVSLDAEGVTINDNWRVMGMRGTGSNDVELKDVFIPEAAITGRRPQGTWHMLFHVISMIAFALIYSAYVGVAEGARLRALAAVRKRPESEVSALIAGEMENKFTEAELAHERMMRLADNAQPGPETTSTAMICRTLVGSAAIATVEKAMELVGGAGFYRKMGLERAFRDVQAARYHPLQEKPQQRLTGRLALGWDIDG
jgi:alkylation response protein AidB-like acyl-CoA dehydrogenase